MTNYFQRMEVLFHAALDVDERERDTFIIEQAAGDARLVHDVQELLLTSKDEAVHLEQAMDAREGKLPEELEALGREMGPAPPEKVGTWTLGRRLGVGGMGEVFYATREEDGVQQQAAVKLIRPGPTTRELVRRFTIERQVLAQLAHPYTARFLDAGATEDGSPWFAMEYVEGEPIDAWCDSRETSVLERLHLFRKVCEAVQHSHANLIVHRDIKPSNVYVLPDGSPRLLDFGIAKVLDDRGADQGERTRTGALFFSPEFASPEHILGQPVTTVSDVYSLGVLLFELMTGHRPYRRTTRSTFELERAICEEAPARASMVVLEGVLHLDGATSEGSTVLARRRATRPVRLARALRGDLDTVLAKALAKEPQDRYPSVEAFSHDIACHIGGLPISARKPTVTYRVTKFVQRHRAACVVALIILVLAMRLQVQSLHARQAQAAIRMLGGTMGEMMDAMGEKGLRRWSPEDIQAQTEEYAAAVANYPFDDVDKVLHLTRVARRWRDVGNRERAVEAVFQANELAQRVMPRSDPRRLDLEIDAAMYGHGDVGNLDVAIRLLEEALEAIPPDDLRRRSTVWYSMIGMLLLAQDYDKASRVFDAWSVATLEGPFDREERVGVLRALAAYHSWTLRDPVTARPYVEELERTCRPPSAITERNAQVPATHPAIVDAALHWQDMGEYRRALSCYDLGMRVIDTLYAEDHPQLWIERCDYAMLLKDAWLDSARAHPSQIERALKMAKESCDAMAGIFGDDDHRVALERVKYAKVLTDAGHFEEAEEQVLLALPLLEGAVPVLPTSTGIQLCTTWTLLGRILIALDRPVGALAVLRKSESGQVRMLTAHDWELAKTRSLIGAALSHLGEGQEAEQLLEKNHQVIEDGRGPSHYRTLDSLERVVRHFRRHGPQPDLEHWKGRLERARGLQRAKHVDALGQSDRED